MIPSKVHQWLAEQGYGKVSSSRAVSGGCINNGMQIETSSGESFFLKTNPSLPVDTFAVEVEGLTALRKEGGPRVPETFLAGEDFLLMEDLRPGPKRADFWSSLGRQLAALHGYTNSQYGFGHDNYLGSTPQPNGWLKDGYTFFAEQRIMYQAKLAERNGYFHFEEMELAERLCGRLRTLIPEQPASLIHGDLWGGNVISDRDGNPAIIDPATHYGWMEAELGMTALFGGFGEAFYQAYAAEGRLESGWRERLPIYNLYHLMNHLNLFGRGYYGDVMGILRRYR